MASTNPARGMRDFLPADVRKRNYVIGIIKEVYESYGFEPLETPAVENIETLLGKYGEEGNQLVFKILKRGEKLKLETESSLQPSPLSLATDGLLLPSSGLADLALRYDLTVPLARVVANNRNELPKFFKRYQIQPVWRADRPAKGRFREFYQCDVDAIGSESMVIETGILSAISDILESLRFTQFRIHVNHRKFLTDWLNASGVNQANHADALIAIDKKDKIGDLGVKKELEGRGVSQNSCERIMDFLYNMRDLAAELGINDLMASRGTRETFDSWNKQMLKRMEDFEVKQSDSFIDELQTLLNFVEGSSAGGRLFINPTLARGLSYYTGSIMELDVAGGVGSLGGGGRYDGLIGMFGKEQIPACGFSLGLERILVVMEERGMFPPEIAESTPADVMVTIWSQETIGESLKLASELRAAGIRTTVYPEADKLGKQFKYADSIKVHWVCVIRESEIAEDQVTLKNLATGEQNTYPRSEIASKVI